MALVLLIAELPAVMPLVCWKSEETKGPQANELTDVFALVLCVVLWHQRSVERFLLLGGAIPCFWCDWAVPVLTVAFESS